MKEGYVEITEYYDKQGICRKRTVNGMEIPPDEEPSIFLMQDIAWVEEKKYLTKKTAEKLFKV